MLNIFSIATNNYKNFLNPFYNSFNKNFILNENKNFYFFCDDLNHDVFKNNNVKGYEIQHQNWPYITLNRYKNIKNILNDIKDDNSLCFFIDIDMEAVKQIEKINIPSNKKYIGVIHPASIHDGMFDSYENNKESVAYVNTSNLSENTKYIQGCLWGGFKKNFNYMINCLEEMVQKDLEKNIIAKWHDESHLNKFKTLNNNDFGLLNSGFCYPENWSLPENIEKIIIHKDKDLTNFPRHKSS